jgi:pimeloyl-ACP methyl ester carboxylesterase
MAGNAAGVVLLHGLGRTPLSMARLSRRLSAAGYATANLGYPSRRSGVLACAAGVLPAVRDFRDRLRGPVAVVGHSMGGILARHLAAAEPGLVGAIVMLASPNKGSEAADVLSAHRFGRIAFGPAIHDLRTDAWGMHPVPDCPVTVVAGSRVQIPFFRRAVQGPNDGLVSLDRARLGIGETFVRVEAGHTFVMDHPEAVEAVLAALPGRNARPSG